MNEQRTESSGNGQESPPSTGKHGRATGVRGAAKALVHAVRNDFEMLREGRAKYLGDSISSGDFPVEVLKRIGLQMMVAIRTMHFFRDAGLVPGAQVMSRLIRYTYGAEIHWEADFAPGVNIVHGNGLVIGSKAHIGKGCVLLHNITLGNAFDPKTGQIGGPTLEENVHIGPSCTLLGAIHVGKGSKLMAGSVLDHSVPQGSLVKPPAPTVLSRNGSEG